MAKTRSLAIPPPPVSLRFRSFLIASCSAMMLAGSALAAGDPETLQRVSDQYVEAHRGNEGHGEREDFSRSAFLAEIENKSRQLAQLQSIDPAMLNADEDIDRRLLTGLLRSDIRVANTLRRWENDPRLYLPGTRLGMLLEPPAGTLPGPELETLLNALPQRLGNGQSNLKRPPARFTQDAIFQAQRSLEALEKGMETIPALSSEPGSPAEKARTALSGWLAFLREQLLPRSDGNWALGREAYDYVLRERWHMQSSAEDIHKRGWAAFEETEAMAAETAARMQPDMHWTAVYESLKADHPSSGELKQAYQHQMDKARMFVRERNILTLPDGERVVTLDTPAAMRRSSPFGTFEMVDPFDDGLEGRLYLTPVEDWMTPEQQAARLSAHHHAWIPIIAVHEAYPGHHAHGIKMKGNPNDLRRVVTEPIFSEGWGLFTEELMFEQGFLQGDAVRLTVLRNRLWRAARVILDSGLHTGQMDFDQAVEFLVERVRFEPYAAALEVGMYIQEPTYVLGYLIGMQEIESIRDEWVRRHGQPEPPSVFYDRLLHTGSIPPRLAWEVLFGPE